MNFFSKALKHLPFNLLKKNTSAQLLPINDLDSFLQMIDQQIIPNKSPTTISKTVDNYKIPVFNYYQNLYGSETIAKLVTLKLINLILAKYHYVNANPYLASFPTMATLDPSNSCQLQCPGCVHSSNQKFRQEFDWPRGYMTPDDYQNFIDWYGPTGFLMTFYNYGEPLLNKNTPKFIKLAKQYLLTTILSTNLSLKIDADEIVKSGLDQIILSIDGITQDTYGVFRRKGNLDLVFENIKKLVEYKKRYNSLTPYISWQFLTFEHNYHETPKIIEKARALGVDECSIVTPFAVTTDDLTFTPVTSEHEGIHNFTSHQPGNEFHTPDIFENYEHIDNIFKQDYCVRLDNLAHQNNIYNQNTTPCTWLYNNLTIDSHNRIMPCCGAPGIYRNLVYGEFKGGGKERTSDKSYNSDKMVLSRLSFGERDQYEKLLNKCVSTAPHCANCREHPGIPSLLFTTINKLLTGYKYDVNTDNPISLLSEWIRCGNTRT